MNRMHALLLRAAIAFRKGVAMLTTRHLWDKPAPWGLREMAYQEDPKLEEMRQEAIARMGNDYKHGKGTVDAL